MHSTAPTNSVNRVADYFDRPLPEIPAHPHDRQDMLAETVLQAVQAMRGLLKSADKAIVLKAAEAILALEQTRIRHGTNVIGCRVRLIPDWESRKEMQDCITATAPPTAAEVEENAAKEHAMEVRAELKKLEETKPAAERKKVAPNAGRVFVQNCLKDWNIPASAVPAGKFWDAFLQRDAGLPPRKNGFHGLPSRDPALN
jgi:hypothetical protein